MTNSTPGTARKSNILLSIKTQMIDIQQTMLSLDKSAEEYLEMSVLGLIVYKQWLQTHCIEKYEKHTNL